MNTAELDEWFGRAEDVLTDWEGSVDAMDTGSDDATVSEGGVDVFEITPEISAFRAAFSDPLVLRGAVTDLTGVVSAPQLFMLPLPAYRWLFEEGYWPAQERPRR